MSETALNKSFKEADLQRLRNLIQGKHGEKSTLGVGYNEKFKEEEFVIVNGIKRNKTNLDNARKEINIPLFCPSCSKIMNNQHDKGFYFQYKHCFDCQVNFETKLRILGLWDKYEKNIINNDIDSLIVDFEIWFEEYLNQGTESYITENGNIDRWIGSIKNKLLEDKERTIEFLKKLKK